MTHGNAGRPRAHTGRVRRRARGRVRVRVMRERVFVVGRGGCAVAGGRWETRCGEKLDGPSGLARRASWVPRELVGSIRDMVCCWHAGMLPAPHADRWWSGGAGRVDAVECLWSTTRRDEGRVAARHGARRLCMVLVWRWAREERVKEETAAEQAAPATDRHRPPSTLRRLSGPTQTRTQAHTDLDPHKQQHTRQRCECAEQSEKSGGRSRTGAAHPLRLDQVALIAVPTIPPIRCRRTHLPPARPHPARRRPHPCCCGLALCFLTDTSRCCPLLVLPRCARGARSRRRRRGRRRRLSFLFS